METVSLSYVAMTVLIIIGCIGTCIMSKCDICIPLRRRYMQENVVNYQTPPPYDNTDTNSNINIQPPPYKFESSNIQPIYDNIV